MNNQILTEKEIGEIYRAGKSSLSVFDEEAKQAKLKEKNT